jgi:PadR family transcriptional regulator PadR
MGEQASTENTQSQMRKGTLEFMVLLIIARGPAYASDILAELKAAEMIVVEGTLYPLLSRLRATELVSYSWEESSAGPPRKYYELTTKGKDALKSLKETWKKLNRAVAALD